MTRDDQVEKLFEITRRERHYLEAPDDFADIPFRWRRVRGRDVRYIPLNTSEVFSMGSTPLFSIKRHARYQRFPEHCHDGVEFNYMYRGRCRQVVNGNPLVLEEGQTLLLSNDTVHTVLPLGDDDILLNLNVNPRYLIEGVLGRLSGESIVSQFLVDSLELSMSHESCLLFPSQENRCLRTYVENLLGEWKRPSIMARDIVESLFVLFISELVVTYQEAQVEDGGAAGTALPILQYLEHHYADCTLEGTAERFSLNPTYLSALLKEKVGLSYRELVQHLRLSAAERLLKTTSLPVSEIARQVGYENVTFFYRIFERRRGCKPGEYRSQAN